MRRCRDLLLCPLLLLLLLLLLPPLAASHKRCLLLWVRAREAECSKFLPIYNAVAIEVKRSEELLLLCRRQYAWQHFAQVPPELRDRETTVVVIVEAVEEAVEIHAVSRVGSSAQLGG